MEEQTKRAVLWGFTGTKTGKKIHLGEHVNWTERRISGKEIACVDAFCGAIIDADYSTFEERPGPERFQEYCKRCFAVDAWIALEEKTLKTLEAQNG